MSSVYYSAAWTECGCLISCSHRHRTVAKAVGCIRNAGNYVVVIEDDRAYVERDASTWVPLMVKCLVTPSITERRVALERRRRVAEMSLEEMQRELLTSEVTGLPNRRAFDEAEVAAAVAMCDVDGLKALNNYGYETGNALLRAMADALREAGVEAYHDKGDEFLCRDNQTEALQVKLERAKALLRVRTTLVRRTDGNTLSIRGANFSYGVGKDVYEAEIALKYHKASRESRGAIARGELRGITVRTYIAGVCTSTSGEVHDDCTDLV